MYDFNFYLSEGKVKKQKVDFELAKSLINDSINRAEKVMKLDKDIFSKIIFESIYDSLRGILDALLAVNGYKSYSHEASIAFLKKFDIEDSLVNELDMFRYKRNSSKYYGRDILKQDTTEIIEFYNTHANKFIQLCNLEDNCSDK